MVLSPRVGCHPRHLCQMQQTETGSLDVVCPSLTHVKKCPRRFALCTWTGQAALWRTATSLSRWSGFCCFIASERPFSVEASTAFKITDDKKNT